MHVPARTSRGAGGISSAFAAAVCDFRHNNFRSEGTGRSAYLRGVKYRRINDRELFDFERANDAAHAIQLGSIHSLFHSRPHKSTGFLGAVLLTS